MEPDANVELVRRLVAEVLDLPEVRSGDHIVDLGGDSLHATHLASRMWQEAGAAPSVPALLSAGTPVRIAELLVREQEAARMPPVPAGALPVPLADSQAGFVLAEELGRGAENVIVAAFEIEGPFDVEGFDRALLDVVARHDILHVRYADGPEGLQLERVPVPEPGTLLAEGEAPLEELAEIAFQGVDLFGGRPVAAAVSPREAQALLCVAMHHAALDGESEDLLLRDLGSAYASRIGYGMPGAIELPTEFAAYVRWHRLLLEEVAERQELFWRQELRGVEPLPWSVGAESASAEYRRFPLSLEGCRGRIQARAESAGMTPHGIALTDFFVALRDVGAADDFAVGTSVSGRRHPAFDDTVGCFLNSVAVRPGAIGKAPLPLVQERVWAALHRSLSHQDLPLSRVVRLCEEGQPVSHPVFQAFFEFQRAPADLDLVGCRVRRRSLERLGGTLFDVYLELRAATGDGELEGSLIVRDSAVDEADAEALTTSLEVLLSSE